MAKLKRRSAPTVAVDIETTGLDFREFGLGQRVITIATRDARAPMRTIEQVLETYPGPGRVGRKVRFMCGHTAVVRTAANQARCRTCRDLADPTFTVLLGAARK